MALPAPNPILKRNRTTLVANIPQKCRHSTRLRTNLGVAKNTQGSISQPIELSTLESEQYLQLEGHYEPKLDHEEETCHSRDVERNESRLPSTPNTSPTRDVLNDIELA